MSASVCVLDASVGVKWFRDEPGSEEARQLLSAHIRGETVIAIDVLFLYEVLGATSRRSVALETDRVWADLRELDLGVVPLSDELVAAASAVRAECGCSLYDAFSAGLARLLKAPLYSADVKAHGVLPEVRLIG